MPTIYDVAKRARVSTYTVSSVINRSAFVSPELTQRVQIAIRELDYTPNALARGLQTRRTLNIAMLIPDIGSPFYAKVVHGVEDRLRQNGYSLLLGNTYNRPDEQARYLEVFKSQQVDGFLMFIAAGDESHVARLSEKKKPMVFIGRMPNTFKADAVTADNVLGTRMVTDHFVKCGHTRIGILIGQRSLSTIAERIEGWRTSMKKHKLDAPEEYIGDGDWTEESGYQAAKNMLALPKPPTALYASNFMMMTGALRAIRDAGLRCPEDVQMASSNDSPWLDYFQPSITTVVQPSYAMGDQAADLLLKRIQRPGRKFESVVLNPEIHVR